MNIDRHCRLIAATAATLAIAAGVAACGSGSEPATTATGATAATRSADEPNRIPAIVEKVQLSIVTVFASSGDAVLQLVD